MARARNIKPGFFTNDELVELPFEIRLLFIGLWTIADKLGRLVDRPKKIKMEIFPADDVDCDAGLTLLASRGFLQRYKIGGGRFIQIANWAKHQNPHIKEAPSIIPEFPVLAPEIPVLAGLIPDSPSLIPDTREKPKHARSATPSTLASDSPAVISIPLNTGDEYPITEAQCSEFAGLYRAVDVPQQLRSIRAWAITNPAKRKTKAGILRFVNSWLSRAQDQGGTATQPRAGPPATQSKTLTAIQNLQGLKNELAENRTADRLPEAALLGPRSNAGH